MLDRNQLQVPLPFSTSLTSSRPPPATYYSNPQLLPQYTASIPQPHQAGLFSLQNMYGSLPHNTAYVPSRIKEPHLTKYFQPGYSHSKKTLVQPALPISPNAIAASAPFTNPSNHISRGQTNQIDYHRIQKTALAPILRQPHLSSHPRFTIGQEERPTQQYKTVHTIFSSGLAAQYRKTVKYCVPEWREIHPAVRWELGAASPKFFNAVLIVRDCTIPHQHNVLQDAYK